MFKRANHATQAAVLGGVIFLSACQSGAPPRAAEPLLSPDAATAQSTGRESFSHIYRLGAGDKVRITVFGEEDLSREYQVGSEGTVSLSLIGQVRAESLTLVEFEEAVAERLRDGFIKEPSVSVEVVNYRPFYIYGEVGEAGEYPYQAGMSVLNAVAVAGGYSYRANTRDVFITRKGLRDGVRYPASQETIVMPGDVIRVPERLF